ncbi:MAG: type II toxin-antitoxin system Phd/YefM family antitoxin [Tepidisphaeraceae bacterium]|jgi:prevent-host-death family protein
MINLTEIRSLSDFQRNAKAHIRRLKKTGKPEVLTVNGEAAVVVQDAASYQKLLDEVDQREALEGIRRGLESIERGEGIPLDDFVKQMTKKYDIDRTA